MNLLLGHDKTVAEWVARQAHSKAPCDPYTAIGWVTPDGRLTGGVVFTGYNGDTVELSLAGRAAATRSAWAAIVSYVFEQLGCQRMQMHTNRRNKRVLRMLAHRSGLRHEGIARRYFGKHGDGVVYALTVDELAAFRAKWRI